MMTRILGRGDCWAVDGELPAAEINTVAIVAMVQRIDLCTYFSLLWMSLNKVVEEDAAPSKMTARSS
jgi:hypothetical protein